MDKIVATGGAFQGTGILATSQKTGEPVNAGYSPPDALTALGTVITDPVDLGKLIAGAYTGNAGLAASGFAGVMGAIAPVLAQIDNPIGKFVEQAQAAATGTPTPGKAVGATVPDTQGPIAPASQASPATQGATQPSPGTQATPTPRRSAAPVAIGALALLVLL